jgi:CHASE2 domain-containing sensor protein
MKFNPIVRKLLFVLPFFLLTAFLSLTHCFDRYELLSYDLRMQLRPSQPISDRIALIEINDRTLQLLNQWPIPRDFHASLVDVLTKLGAKAVVFDVIFSDPAREDDVFAESIKKSGRVYLPQVFSLRPVVDPVELLNTRIPLIASVNEKLRKSNPRIGHINVIVDPDGKTRRTVLFIHGQDQLVPQLGLKAACDVLGVDCSQAEFQKNKATLGGRLSIPVSNYNEFMVNYPGTWENSFERFSYEEVLRNYQEWKETNKSVGRLSRLKGRVCFVGLTAAGTVDLRSTPLESIYPMLGLQASVFNSVIEKKFIQRAPELLNAVETMIVLALCLVMGLRGTPLFSFLGSLLLGLSYTLMATISMNRYGVWIDLFLPMVVIVVTYLGCVSIRWLNEMQIRKILEKEMTIAAEIQKQFLATKDLESMNVTVGTWFQPAKFVAGDLYEVFKISEHRTGMLLGDVSGKGLAASLLMAQAISLFRIFSRLKTSSPGEILQNLNNELSGRFPGRFVTAAYCIADKQQGQVEIASAGQGPVLIFRRQQGVVEELPIPGSIPLGIMTDSTYESLKFNMTEQDVLILISDGVFEAQDVQGQEWGIDNLKKTIIENAGKSPLEILECVKAALGKFLVEDAQFDDITIIIFSFMK